MARPKANRRNPVSASRLSVYRPVLDRIVFGVALLGILVTAHLYIQQGRGFDRGCLGFSSPSAPADCAVVTQSEASTLLGISNAMWGIGFYVVVTLLSLALPLVVVARQRGIKRLRAALIAAGFAYSMYLVYIQSVQLNTFCVLCLTSAGLVTTLFVLQVIDYFKPPQRSTAPPAQMRSQKVSREAVVLGSLTLAVFLLIGADVAYFSSLDKAAGSADNLVLDPEAARTASDGSAAGTQCGYDASRDPVEDYQSLVNPLDPVKGPEDAPVTVIEYFDMNCPHCKTLYPIMEMVQARHAEVARFVYKPFVLGQHSVLQTAALYAAAQEGKFFDMMALQFANQQPRGLSVEQLRAIAARIDLNPDVMMQRVQSGIYMTVLQMQRRQGEEIGINAVPTVLINGRFVDPYSKSLECLSQLIEQAAS